MQVILSIWKGGMLKLYQTGLHPILWNPNPFSGWIDDKQVPMLTVLLSNRTHLEGIILSWQAHKKHKKNNGMMIMLYVDFKVSRGDNYILCRFQVSRGAVYLFQAYSSIIVYYDHYNIESNYKQRGL